MNGDTKVPSTDQLNTKTMGAPMCGAIEQALLRPTLYDKCQALTAALRDGNTRELQQQFPIIVQKIFGFGLYSPGWQLESMLKNKGRRRDSDAVLALLRPNGAVFTDLIYKLMCEEAVFEFPYQLLPEATKRKIEEGLPISELYNNKFTSVAAAGTAGSQTDPVLALDALEFYFFVFTHKIVSSTTKGQELYLEPADWLYPTLLNDYLQHFLPMRGLPTPPPYALSSKASTSQLHSPRPLSPHISLTRRRHGLGLLKQTPSYFSRSLSMQQPMNSDSVDSDVMWRSEKLVQIIAEFWLGQTALDTSLHSSLGFSHSAGREPLPSHDLIMLVRMFIKHVHAFVHSSDGDVLPAHLQNPSTILGSLKRSMLGRFIQKPFYGFVKRSVENWPLDTSFRPILETWLTFLRPWRYAASSISEEGTHLRNSPAASDSRTDVDGADFVRLWDGFIREHSLFYSVILQEVLSRFLRIDLASSKMSYQLSRVCHVFALPELVNILRDVDMSARAAPCSYAFHGEYQEESYADMTAAAAGLVNGGFQVLEAQISSIEVPNFTYCPLFSEDTLQQVRALLKEMVNAQRNIMKLMKKSEERRSSTEGNTLLSFIGLGNMVEFNEAQLSAEDREHSSTKKWLQQSIVQLSDVFKIQVPQWDIGDPLNVITESHSETLPDHVIRSDGSAELTALGQYQVLNGLKRFPIVERRCDPELQPVRSFESDIGVLQLYKLSCALNRKYGAWFCQLYNKGGIVGAIAGRILTLPKQTSSQTAAADLGASQPRISLRVFANYYFLGYAVVGYLVMSSIVGRAPAVALAFLLFVLYIGILAFLNSLKGKA